MFFVILFLLNFGGLTSRISPGLDLQISLRIAALRLLFLLPKRTNPGPVSTVFRNRARGANSQFGAVQGVGKNETAKSRMRGLSSHGTPKE